MQQAVETDGGVQDAGQEAGPDAGRTCQDIFEDMDDVLEAHMQLAMDLIVWKTISPCDAMQKQIENNERFIELQDEWTARGCESTPEYEKLLSDYQFTEDAIFNELHPPPDDCPPPPPPPPIG